MSLLCLFSRDVVCNHRQARAVAGNESRHGLALLLHTQISNRLPREQQHCIFICADVVLGS